MGIGIIFRRDMSTLLLNSNANVNNDNEDFTFKAISGQIGVDKAEGIVEAFVSGIGNKDSVGDIVLPGAFKASLHRRKPRVVWGHDWNQPIGKVLEMYEVGPADPRLPEKMRKAGIGGLFAKVQFNLNTERGREAFANVAFYGQEQEWSIGYKTITADFNAEKQANMLKEVELYEVSPVLHGANQLTGTISVKDDEEGIMAKGHWEDDDKDGPQNSADSVSSMIGRALSQALRKPVRVLQVMDNSVVFQAGEDSVWMATFSRDNGQIQISKPTRVKPTVSYTPVGDSNSPSMMIKDNTELPESLRDANPEEGTWATPDIALAWSKTFGCDGYHSHGGGYLPCSTHEEYEKALKQFDGNANLNAHNNYLAGVEVEEAKDAESEKGACGCETEEKGGVHGHSGYRKAKKDWKEDPMALLLMAYNAMLPVRGASELRESTLAVINALEEFLTSNPASAENSEKALSGFVVHVKCNDNQALDVVDAMNGVSVLSFKSEEGVDLHFSTKIAHDELLEKVAFGLASLEFDPQFTITDNTSVDTDEGVQ
tara:strand:- start:325 stop:1950 length:1626 start_codon:yes stop_codon:yes gene_type:complete